jgi:protein SCO1/2
MRYLAKIGLVILFLFAGASAGAAHSLKDLESQLGERERYFQTLDKDAPGFELQDADGNTLRLADFRDKVVILHFVYTNCPDVCPLHAERIAETQQMINQTPMKDQVQFITVTTDPTNDTAKVMKAYGPAHGLDPANWMFLSSGASKPEDTTRKLAAQYGHKFAKMDEGYQIHGVVTHVIDRKGRWRANFHGLKFKPTNLVLFINALVNDLHQEQHQEPGFWDRLWSFF